MKPGETESKQVKIGTKQPRPYGLCKGEFRVPDDFNEPLPEEIIRQFEGQTEAGELILVNEPDS